MTLLAVYGTLRQGYSNYAVHLDPRLPVYSGTYKLPYKMYTNKYYPLIVKDDTNHPLVIEIYELDKTKIEELDRLEEPYGYFRRTITLPTVEQSVDIYIYEGVEIGSEFVLVPDGNFIPEKDINQMDR